MLKLPLRALFGLAITILGLIFTPFGASGQPQCDARERVISVLSKKYKELIVSRGVTANGGLIEVLTSEGGATWSILVTTPQGMSCLVAAGEGWQTLALSPAGPAI